MLVPGAHFTTQRVQIVKQASDRNTSFTTLFNFAIWVSIILILL